MINKIPKVFIGSSSQKSSLELAERVKLELEQGALATVDIWKNVFLPGEMLLTKILGLVQTYHPISNRQPEAKFQIIGHGARQRNF
jgi:hypothetical protein